MTSVRKHHAMVQEGLAHLGHTFVCDPGLVRGLDYYTRTAFEVCCSRLGAQNAVGGGGRYDKLVEQLGGKTTPATGYAIGIERLLMLVTESREGAPQAENTVVFITVDSDETRLKGIALARRLRHKGITVKMDHLTNKLGKQMGRASRSGAHFAVIIGSRELEQGIVGLKNLLDGSQAELTVDELVQRFST